MNISNLKSIYVDGQKLYLLNQESWDSLVKSPVFDGCAIDDADFIFSRHQSLLHFNDLYSALAVVNERVEYYELLYIEGHFYRISLEDAICEHCNTRTGAAASIGSWCNYTGVKNKRLAIRQNQRLPVVLCPACKNPLERRHIVWIDKVSSSTSHTQCC